MLAMKPCASFESVNAMLMQSFSAKAVMSAVELKVFDHLQGKAFGAAALADELGLVAERLEPVLDILVAAELLDRKGSSYINSSVASEFLVSGSHFYQGESMRLTMRFNAMVEDCITDLLAGGDVDRVRTDEDWATERTLEGTEQDAKGGALPYVVNFVEKLPGFENFKAMCDIGGNHGMYTMAVLEKNENMHGTVYDLPHVVLQAQKRCNMLGFGDRITMQPLDFREERLPAAQFDLIFTSHVLYAFKDDLSKALAKIAEGLKPGGWFVSSHYSGRNEKGNEMTKASLELLTRLCGYSSHFIEKEELINILESLDFEEIRCRPVHENGLGLMIAGRKA
ncbi:methyltransferase [Maridesulfovibrio hydrothermalis]|uniref:Putative Methyltransferase type 12 n=1 Tax=Maridesulfovibrio hydrothermalis AM13 = DSM 14728 TaxID=1121451 RepID=L0RBQ6_9BACT|nr:methyltransferase [Maridesulfovibrio hydrothermalis]CCO23657.1 putative Methyltransferase type 12 [Maridesulfovibrio hydrothermalis AM13 = DSM 14728]